MHAGPAHAQQPARRITLSELVVLCPKVEDPPLFYAYLPDAVKLEAIQAGVNKVKCRPLNTLLADPFQWMHLHAALDTVSGSHVLIIRVHDWQDNLDKSFNRNGILRCQLRCMLIDLDDGELVWDQNIAYNEGKPLLEADAEAAAKALAEVLAKRVIGSLYTAVLK
jgi:hypothetical protein